MHTPHQTKESKYERKPLPVLKGIKSPIHFSSGGVPTRLRTLSSPKDSNTQNESININIGKQVGEAYLTNDHLRSAAPLSSDKRNQSMTDSSMEDHH